MLGFPVAKQLKKDGYFVDILTTNKSSAVARLGGNNNYIEGDVKSIDVLRKIFSENNYDGVHINLSSLNYKELQEIEVQGTKNKANKVAPPTPPAIQIAKGGHN